MARRGCSFARRHEPPEHSPKACGALGLAPKLQPISGMGDRLRGILGPGNGRAGLALVATTGVAVLAAWIGLLDPVAFLITVGGALAVMRATFSKETIVAAWERLGEALESRVDPDEEIENLIEAFKRFARIHRVEGARALDRASLSEGDSFLRTAVQRALECADVEDVRASLYGEARVRASEGEQARNVLLTLGRLFPAFGLIGTLVGLVMVLRGLGDATGLAAVAPALGVTVLTTLYGAVLANVVVLPLATKLQGDLARESVLLQMIIQGAEMLHEREYPTRIERALRSQAGLPNADEAIGVTVLHERIAA